MSAAPDRCVACDSVPVRGRTLPGDVELRRCPQCRLEWWNWPAFDPATLYDHDYFQSADVQKGYNDYAAMEPGVRRTARTRLRRIERYLAQSIGYTRRLLELGCGTGVFLDEARRCAWSGVGVEVSRYAAGVARQRGLDVIESAADEPLALDGQFDCVVLWDVLEHLRDPVGALRLAAQRLRPGGLLALSTGDVASWVARLCGTRWHLYTIPEHLFFYTAQSLRLLVERAGFRLCGVAREWQWVPVGYLAERLSKTLFRRNPPPMLVRPRLVVPATLFDIVGVYAIRDPRLERTP